MHLKAVHKYKRTDKGRQTQQKAVQTYQRSVKGRQARREAVQKRREAVAAARGQPIRYLTAILTRHP